MKETNWESISVVISPYTLLIKDQWKNLKSVVIAAEFMREGQSDKEAKMTMCSVSDDIFHFNFS